MATWKAALPEKKMIQPFIVVLVIYTLSLWLFPTPSPSIFYGFAAMVLLLSLARGQDGRRISGVIPGFMVLASLVMLLLYLPTAIKIDYPHFAGLFIAIYCGLVLLLRRFLSRAAVRIIIGLVTVLVFALESRYYGDPGYAVELRHSLALLTALASLIVIAVTGFIYRVGEWINHGYEPKRDLLATNRFSILPRVFAGFSWERHLGAPPSRRLFPVSRKKEPARCWRSQQGIG